MNVKNTVSGGGPVLSWPCSFKVGGQDFNLSISKLILSRKTSESDNGLAKNRSTTKVSKDHKSTNKAHCS